MSFFSKLKEKFAGKQDKAVYLSGFEKSKNTFSDALNQMGSSFHGVDDDFLEQLTIVLLESDVGIELADLICERLKKKCDEYPGIMKVSMVLARQQRLPSWPACILTRARRLLL